MRYRSRCRRSQTARAGVFAVALGAGTVIASGLGGGIASADSGDLGAGNSRGPRTTSADSHGRGRASAPRAVTRNNNPLPSAARANPPNRASALPAAARRVADNQPALAVPAAVGAAIRSTAQISPTEMLAPPANAVGPTATEPLAPAAVRVVSPPVAGVPVGVVRNLASALSTALDDGGRWVPGETAWAVIAGAIRRELSALSDPQIAASKVAPKATSSTSSATTSVTGVNAEKMTISGAGRTASDRKAAGGYALTFSGTGSASTTLTLPTSAALTVRVRTAAGAPDMTLSIDGVRYTTLLVNNTSYTDYTFAGGIAAGTHVISLSSTTATTRDVLYVDTLTVSSGPIIEDFVGKSGSKPGSRWTARSGTGFDSGNQTYSSSNAVLDGQGNLVISAIRNSSGGYTSGWVWSKNTMTFGYGTVSARIKMPQGQGLWPAVWMMGADSDTVGWPASGEIDIVELPSTTTTVYSTLHGPIAGSTGTQQAQIVSSLPDLSTDFHNYWVRHLPNEITFGVDNRTLGTLTPASLGPGETWVYNRPMYLIMNLAVGGAWAGAPNSSPQFPAKMIVDSVRWDPATGVA